MAEPAPRSAARWVTLLTAPLLGVEEPMERLAYALIGPVALQEDTVSFLEQRTVGLHRIDTMFQARVVHRSIMSHLREVTALLEGHPQDPLRTRLARVAGESAVLAAWTAWDLGEGAHSARMYRITEVAARAASDPVIMACANTYQSYATSGPHSHEDALPARLPQAFISYAQPGVGQPWVCRCITRFSSASPVSEMTRRYRASQILIASGGIRTGEYAVISLAMASAS